MGLLTPLSSKKLATERMCVPGRLLYPAMLPILCQTGVGRAWYGRLEEQREAVKPCPQLHEGGHHLQRTRPCNSGNQTYLNSIPPRPGQTAKPAAR